MRQALQPQSCLPVPAPNPDLHRFAADFDFANYQKQVQHFHLPLNSANLLLRLSPSHGEDDTLSRSSCRARHHHFHCHVHYLVHHPVEHAISTRSPDLNSGDSSVRRKKV